MKSVNALSDDELGLLVAAAAALPDAPASWVQAAERLWPAAGGAALRSTGRGLLKQVVAVLSFDSWEPAALASGVRALGSDVRHLLFSASGRDVDLRITPQADRFALAGQVLGPDESGRVELTPDAAPAPAAAAVDTRVAEMDALGEFHLDDVAPGSYRMVLRIGDDEIVLPPIEVGERRP